MIKECLNPFVTLKRGARIIYRSQERINQPQDPLHSTMSVGKKSVDNIGLSRALLPLPVYVQGLYIKLCTIRLIRRAFKAQTCTISIYLTLNQFGCATFSVILTLPPPSCLLIP